MYDSDTLCNRVSQIILGRVKKSFIEGDGTYQTFKGRWTKAERKKGKLGPGNVINKSFKMGPNLLSSLSREETGLTFKGSG